MEQLPPLEYLRSRLAELEANGIDEAKLQEKAVFLRMVFDPRAELQKELDKAQAAILWRTERRSPPRCLECGGTHHRAIDPYGNEIDHPGCEGTFQIKLEYHASQSSYRQLDSEGTSLSKK